MKGNKMCRLHLILLYVCLILCTGCISGERKDAHVVTDEWKIKQMELLLENDPGTAMDKMDSLLPYLKDSMSYYRGIVFKSKAYMLMSRIGDASRMLRQAGSFCTSPSEEDKSDLYASVCNMEGNILARIIRKSKFPQNPKRSVRFSGKRTKRSVQKRKARNTQKAETKVL